MFNIVIVDDNKDFVTYITRIIRQTNDNDLYELNISEYDSGEDFIRSLEAKPD